MARIAGVEPRQAGLITRLLYRLARRKTGQVAGRPELVEPLKITAHHPRLLQALGQMEMGQGAARAVSPELKAIASLKTAMLIGCPF